jgi:glycosyltransferase involved in cell wall biosynthesis
VEHGSHGLLVPEAKNDDPDAWREAYEELYSNPELRIRLYRQAAGLVARRFETRRVYPGFVDVIEDVIQAARADGVACSPRWKVA